MSSNVKSALIAIVHQWRFVYVGDANTGRLGVI